MSAKNSFKLGIYKTLSNYMYMKNKKRLQENLDIKSCLCDPTLGTKPVES